MSVGSSGRIVIEVEPGLKRELYSALYMHGKTLKDWFVVQAKNYVEEQQQLPLNLANEAAPSINTALENK
jgi:hypothetical protein